MSEMDPSNVLETPDTAPSSSMPAPQLANSPNARSKAITIAEGRDTYGILNQHSVGNTAYQVGVSEDKGTRRYMEDAHSFVVDYAGVRGQGFFAVFDGHAGKHAAEWCGQHFHEHFLTALARSSAIPDVLNETFHDVDRSLSHLCVESNGRIHSGCTAVIAFLRIEDESGRQPFLRSSPSTPTSAHRRSSGSDSHSGESGEELSAKLEKRNSNGRVSREVRNISNSRSSSPSPRKSPSASRQVITPPENSRRVLYTANVGDARGVLCRAGKAVRLTYDHKGSDKQEAKRITDAGGFVMSGRVNGVLAVTRSLGDSSMKEFVVGSPYTTETELCQEDEFLILACDGLWDVSTDQAAVGRIRYIADAQEASRTLVGHALSHSTNDNVTAIVVRFRAPPPSGSQ